MEKIKKWLHDKLGWGFRGKYINTSHDDIVGLYMIYKCRFCDKALEKDSQGNWFHLSTLIGDEATPPDTK